MRTTTADTVPARTPDTAADPRLAGTVEELVAAADERTPLRPVDARSGAVFERLRVGDRRLFHKRVRPERDWIMRITGDRDFRTAKAWRAGILHRAAGAVVHTVVDVAVTDGELVVLMDDVERWLVPAGDEPVAATTHRALVDGLAALGAEFAGWHDDVGLVPMADRFRFFAPDHIAGELARPDCDAVLRIAGSGWARLAERAPQLAAVVAAVHARPAALAAALARTPRTFVHGDPKMGNLGVAADGRAILLDWAYPGSGPFTWDLSWYLALNAARLPESKQDTAARYAAALRARGVSTDGWFDAQLALSLLGVAAVFGWEKALGSAAELAWWSERALRGAALLDRLERGWR